jgi:lysophospholipase L1-like esterase
MRKSPVEIVATAGTRAAGVSGVRTGKFGRWADGVNAMRADCVAFADYWQGHNERVTGRPGPLWVVLGDSTAQGLGAPSPHGGYVGQVLASLRDQTGEAWQVLNLSKAGSLLGDVLATQLPRVPGHADLVTCGVGVNDIMYTAPGRLFADLRRLVANVPDGTVLLDLPVPAGVWGMIGRVSVPYVARINRVLHEAAAERGLPVARVSDQFTSPWRGKFARDNFHPSQHGYRDWSRALLTAIAC